MRSNQARNRRFAPKFTVFHAAAVAANAAAAVTVAAAVAVATAATLALPHPAAAGGLQGRMAELEPLLGTWEVQAAWDGGQALWSRATYSPGIGGRCIEGRVLVRDGDGDPYERYFTVFAHDAARDAWVAHNFQADGTVSEMDFDFADGVLTSEWTEGEARIRDRSRLLGDGRLHWTVEVAGPEGEFRTVMDATWTRNGDDAMTQPIDPNRFVTGEPTTSFVREAVIAAPVEAVYRAWTDGEAFAAAYDPGNPQLRADIDLAIGGRYEWLWDGKTGGNGCQVLSFIPDRMVSFTWNAPPDQPVSRAQRTWVVVEFEPAGGGPGAGTRCRLTHLGFGSAPHWQETREYFEKAWPYVLEQLRKNLEAGR